MTRLFESEDKLVVSNHLNIERDSEVSSFVKSVPNHFGVVLFGGDGKTNKG